MKARDDARINPECNECEYLKEKWIKTTEEGAEFWMYSHSYCSAGTCKKDKGDEK